MSGTQSLPAALPQSNQTDIGVLAGAFRQTTNSYKFLFFLGLLRLCEKSRFAQLRLSMRDVVLQMLTVAWYPNRFCRLSFGRQDRVGRVLEEFEEIGPLSGARDGVLTARSVETHLSRLWDSSEATDAAMTLLRYVPFRFLSGFFLKELRGQRDAARDSMIKELADASFATTRPFYRFVEGGEDLELHPLWLAYFRDHHGIVEGWARFEWVEYLQRRNPNTPAIVRKVAAPITRSSLGAARNHWRTVGDRIELKSIYSGQVLHDLSIDHFMPWSFVVHDQLWNLIPLSGSENSSKSNQLPPPEFIEPFARQQLEGLLVARQVLSEKKWRALQDDYCCGLGIAADELLDRDTLQTAYRATVLPLLEIAGRQGFATWSAK
jgi:hypothetical protein